MRSCLLVLTMIVCWLAVPSTGAASTTLQVQSAYFDLQTETATYDVTVLGQPLSLAYSVTAAGTASHQTTSFRS